MSSNKLDYEKEYKKQFKKNLNDVCNEIDSDSMKNKINNWAKKNDKSPKEVRQKILDDDFFRRCFVKEPSKQNFYQNKAADFIKNIDGVENFKTLPQNGSNALYIINGNIHKGENLKNKNQDSKSIDFYWEYNNKKFYASHKYTKEEGGAQDNQYKDIQSFLIDSRDNNLKDTNFVAICDGDYYQNKDNKTKDSSRIERLKRLTNNNNTFVMTINEIPAFLKKF